MSDRPIIGVTVGTPFNPNNMSGGSSDVDVLQELNNSTENSPKATYSANVVNEFIVKPVIDYIAQIFGALATAENVANKSTEIDPDKGVSKDKYTTEEAVYSFGLRIISAHREEVNQQFAVLQGDIDSVAALVGGADNGES